ncbi:6-bladed beta-propeller [Gemmatimonas sp.]|uniref:6-bladed beta-propeller n=1 Tax=Gemmatimonas sp. TaxID=1962908 RepID=UPI003DA65084
MRAAYSCRITQLLSSVVVCALALVSGCSKDSVKGQQDWRTVLAHQEVTSRIDTTPVCLSCLSLDRVLKVDGDASPEAMDETSNVAIDSLGRLWVGQRNAVSVFSEKGAFIGSVGKRGSGPGEFQANGPMFTDARGHVHIFDQVLFRESVFDEKLALLSERLHAPGAIQDVASLVGSDSVLVNAEFADETRVGLPLHILTSRGFTRSFGADGDVIRAASGHLLRQVATSQDGYVFAAHRYTHEISVFAPSGTAIRTYQFAHSWRPPVGGVPSTLTLKSDLWGFVQDVQYDPLGLLVVLSWDPKSNWRDLVEERRDPDGRPYLQEKSDAVSLYKSRISVIDLNRQKVVSTVQVGTALWGLLGASKVYGFEYSALGEPQLAVFSLSLKLAN